MAMQQMLIRQMYLNTIYSVLPANGVGLVLGCSVARLRGRSVTFTFPLRVWHSGTYVNAIVVVVAAVITTKLHFAFNVNRVSRSRRASIFRRAHK